MFVTKDPRLALTLHAWNPLLDTKDPLNIGVVCVVTYRHPLSFASSMLKYVHSFHRPKLEMYIHLIVLSSHLHQPCTCQVGSSLYIQGLA